MDPPPAWCDARTRARGSHVGGWHAPACQGRARAVVDTRAAEEGGEEGLAAQDEASASDAAVADPAARHRLHFPGVATEEADPVADAVEKKVEAALLRVHFHDAPEALANALALEALPAHKVLVLVDAQTSKVRVGVKLVEAAALIMARGGAGGPRRSWWGGGGEGTLGGLGRAPWCRLAGLAGQGGGLPRRSSRARSASS